MMTRGLQEMLQLLQQLLLVQEKAATKNQFNTKFVDFCLSLFILCWTDSCFHVICISDNNKSCCDYLSIFEVQLEQFAMWVCLFMSGNNF